jgi:hypothetical protein
MEKIKHQIRKIIEREYKDALEKGLFDSTSVANQIWELLNEKETQNFIPEPAYGCYENIDEFDQNISD